MATDNNKGKKPAEEASKKKDTRKRFDVNRCDRCKITGKDLPVLKSEWRAVVLCESCLSLVDSADFCSYCFNPILQESDDAPILTCHVCSRRIHRVCLRTNQPFYVPGSPVEPDSFACVDCNPFPATPNLLKTPSYEHSDPTKKKKKEEKEKEEEKEKASESSPRKSRKFLKEEKNAEGSSSGGARSSSGKTRAMKVLPNIPADRVDGIDKWAWEKCDQKEHTDHHHHPNRIYYRCQSFSQGCPVEKHVEQSRDSQKTFDVMYTDCRHNHRLPGHRGSSTTKPTSSPPKSTGRSAKGDSSSNTSKSSSPTKSEKRSRKGSKTSSTPKSAERPL